jgi:hypothetical protein
MILAPDLPGNRPRYVDQHPDSATRNPLPSAGQRNACPRPMRFTVATYNIHKGFTQLNRPHGDP